MNPRSFLHCMAVVLVFAVTPPILAQDLKERELQPAYDFAMVQMPVEIVSVKRNGKELQPGEKIKADDDWLLGLSFTVKNVSDKAIAHVAVSLRITQPKGLVGITLSNGVDLSRGGPRPASLPPSLQPGQSVELTLTKERYPNVLEILKLGNVPRGFDAASYLLERVTFEDDPEIFWEAGYLKRRSPTMIGHSDIIGRYALPTRQ